jgi:uncharacterized protein YlxP (DUF503 family)
MVVGICRVVLELPEGLSLKEKRGPVRSIISRVRTTFNAAVAEVGALDSWQQAVLGVAVVSAEQRHANEMLSKVIDFIEDNLSEGVIADYEMEFIHAAGD